MLTNVYKSLIPLSGKDFILKNMGIYVIIRID